MTTTVRDLDRHPLPNAAISGWWLPLHLFRSLAKHFRDQRDYEHLRDLPDYLLKDIGISRQEIGEKDPYPFF
ncbi:DUF1127 domain-containing protein [Nisaea acidiphila]|uniref:DUF1127 domain-containing protein n=1 Tax=Nisaea acidiphila TaxID=1862145 RepID=A0A9J7ARH9_9PROT|nr:DUF1127 domain-containing protein [Nisaea acidiphila]UUX48948.1 DUF1127 domain-containing protein [Nisaea acidiphila]